MRVHGGEPADGAGQFGVGHELFGAAVAFDVDENRLGVSAPGGEGQGEGGDQERVGAGVEAFGQVGEEGQGVLGREPGGDRGHGGQGVHGRVEGGQRRSPSPRTAVQCAASAARSGVRAARSRPCAQSAKEVSTGGSSAVRPWRAASSDTARSWVRMRQETRRPPRGG